MNLHRSVSIVTGATGGIGRATALALAGRGSRVVISGRRERQLGELADVIGERGGEASPVGGDIASASTARSVVDTAMERFGRIDVLVNCAGYGPPLPLAELPETVWDATIDSCLKGAYLTTRAVLPVMLAADSGRIVQVSSIAGTRAEAKRTAYCAAKWGLEGFSLALDAELADSDVRVHVINPAAVATDWWTMTDDPQPAAVLERMMTPGDVADAIVWLLTLPDRVHVGQLILHNAHSPWCDG